MLKSFYCKQGHPFKRDTRPDKCPTCGDPDVIHDTVTEELTPLPLEAWLALGKK